MKCRQCEETKKITGCTNGGACGKTQETANLQDVLIYSLRELASVAKISRSNGKNVDAAVVHIYESLFSTLTNVNFDPEYFRSMISRSEELIASLSGPVNKKTDWNDVQDDAGIDALSDDPDLRSLKELLLYGLKGLAAYYHHARILGYDDESVEDFLIDGLVSLGSIDDADAATAKVLECGAVGVTCMALLDRANTETYGTPEITSVKIGVGSRPGILITGHDLKDLEELLEQSKDSGIDVYTHGEMLPANAYPSFKKYSHLVGNYGGAWHSQKEEFESFNGPILVTTNCLVPPKGSYKDRLYTTGLVGFEGVKHIDVINGKKDFSEIVEMAKRCAPPAPIDSGEIPIGFAHATVLSVADKILDAVNSGALKRLVVMAGCDGRRGKRTYYTEFAESLPKDTVILTAGCAKYRYNKLALGDIGGIPRVIDAGQCNDCYSLAVVAIKLAETLGVGINDLPLSFNISWYEQKACLVLLSLLHLGVKDIMLGPDLPEFISPGVLNVLVNGFGIKGISNVEDDRRILKIE